MPIDNNKSIFNTILSDFENYKGFEFFNDLKNNINNSNYEINVSEHYLKQDIDMTWVKKIEETIIPLDTILRDPKRFIKNDEDIVPIGLARGITDESVKHLAQHTNMIQSYKKDTVTPSKILNVRKEESFETYENRFIYTLLKKLQFFVDRKMKAINDKIISNNEYEINYSGDYNVGKDRVKFNINYSYLTPNTTDVSDLEELISANVDDLSSIQRVERLRKIIFDFIDSRAIKNMGNVVLIKPPITMTNLLSKNPNYRSCVDLYMFLEQYRDNESNLSVVSKKTKATNDMLDPFSSINAIDYIIFKNYTSSAKQNDRNIHSSSSTTLTQRIEDIVDNYDFSVDDLRKVFLERLNAKESKIFAIEKRMMYVINQSIIDEEFYKKKRDEVLKQERLLILKERKKLAKIEEEVNAKENITEPQIVKETNDDNNSNLEVKENIIPSSIDAKIEIQETMENHLLVDDNESSHLVLEESTLNENDKINNVDDAIIESNEMIKEDLDKTNDSVDHIENINPSLALDQLVANNSKEEEIKDIKIDEVDSILKNDDINNDSTLLPDSFITLEMVKKVDEMVRAVTDNKNNKESTSLNVSTDN